jgi:hypothetical protein
MEKKMSIYFNKLGLGRGLAVFAGLFLSGLGSAKNLNDGNRPTWIEVGDTNWSISEDLISASAGNGFLVTAENYSDFKISVKFRPGANTNSGIFLRCSDPKNISDKSCYEVNIFDHRPDPSGRTGSIVNVASPRISINSEERWNTYEISAQGSHLVVKLNGVVTVDTHDDGLTEGVIALQLAAGDIRFKDISITRGIDKTDAIRGVWKLTKFELDDGRGSVQPWCEGSHGTIMYAQNYMSVSINCSSNSDKKVLYSGPYHFEGHDVVHEVKNFSDESLQQRFVRKVEMPTENKLDLVGPFGNGGKAVVSWERLSHYDSVKGTDRF